MKTRLLFYFFVCWVQITLSQNNLQWQGHFSYNTITDFSQSASLVFTATDNAVLVKNPTSNTVKTKTTIDGLSGQNITALYHSVTFNKTVIGYENGLIIVVNEQDERVVKLVGIVQKQLPANIKKINHFSEYDGIVYVSADFGIVQLNLQTLQFGDTYFIGANGGEISVKQITVFQGSIFAATADGIRKASISNPNLIDYNQWDVFNEGSGFVGVTTNSAELIAAESNGNLYRYSGQNFTPLQSLEQEVLDLRTSADKILVTTSSNVYFYNSQMVLEREIEASQVDMLNSIRFTCSILLNDTIYIGTEKHGQYESTFLSNGTFINTSPAGPIQNNIFSLTLSNSALWSVYGDYNSIYNPYPLDEFGYSKFDFSTWKNIPYSDVFGAKSLTRISINPKNDNELYLSSFFSGLLKVENDTPTILYNQTNSGLESLTALGPDYVDIRVNATAFDKSGNLWIGNGWVNNGLKMLSSDGSWKSYNMTGILENPEITSYAAMLVDRNNVKWMATNTDGVVGFNESSNTFKKITIGADSGNLPTVDVRSMAIDNRNQLWIGTARGLRVLNSVNNFQSQSQLSSNSIIIEEDGLAQELLNEQFIMAIAVDGANNKWIGTFESGVFMVSPNGQETKYHFTIDNSPLPSNTINDIKINQTTGEVFIATANGLVSFKGISTEGQDNLNNVFVYPNPVRPQYSGTVKIAGLMDRANVKITDVTGNLVYETTSTGGTIEWDTTAFGKHKVASGVYMIFIATDDGAETKVKKVMIIR